MLFRSFTPDSDSLRFSVNWYQSHSLQESSWRSSHLRHQGIQPHQGVASSLGFTVYPSPRAETRPRSGLDEPCQRGRGLAIPAFPGLIGRAPCFSSAPREGKFRSNAVLCMLVGKTSLEEGTADVTPTADVTSEAEPTACRQLAHYRHPQT